MVRSKNKGELVHPLLIRMTHWVNVIALGIMVASGLRIYLASPIFDLSIPTWSILGGWLAGARMWHFFGMWLFVLNGMIWVGYNMVSRHGRETTIFRIRDLKRVIPSIVAHVKFRFHNAGAEKYNPLQKLAYSVVGLLGVGSLLTGIGIYWPVQFSWLTGLFGGFDRARVWHFIFMCALLAFIPGHLFMVAVTGRTSFVSFLTGRRSASDH